MKPCHFPSLENYEFCYQSFCKIRGFENPLNMLRGPRLRTTGVDWILIQSFVRIIFLLVEVLSCLSLCTSSTLSKSGIVLTILFRYVIKLFPVGVFCTLVYANSTVSFQTERTNQLSRLALRVQGLVEFLLLQFNYEILLQLPQFSKPVYSRTFVYVCTF